MKISPQIYPVHFAVKVAMTLLGSLFIIMGMLLVGLVFEEGFSEEFLVKPVSMIVGSCIIGLGVFWVVGVFKSRLELSLDRIRLIGVFKNREMKLSDIAGCKIPKGSPLNLTIFLRDFKNTKFILELSYKSKPEILKWFREKFPVDYLTVKEIKDHQAKEIFLNNPKFGINKEQRYQKLENAKWWAAAISRFCFYGSFLCAFAPRSFVWANGLIVALPVFSIFLTFLFKGLIKRGDVQQGYLPSIYFSLHYAVVAMLIRAYFCWNVLPWNSIWLPWSAITIFLFLIGLKFEKPFSKTIISLIVLFIFCAIPAYGIALNLNGVMEISPAEVVNVTITNKDTFFNYKKEKVFQLQIDPWKYNENASSLAIDEDAFGKFKVGVDD